MEHDPQDRKSWIFESRLFVPLFSVFLTTLFASLFFVSCAGTPLPDPPAINPEAIVLSVEGQDTVIIEGRAGAVSDPGSIVKTWNLDRSEPPPIALVREDGSFMLSVLGLNSHRFRLQAENGGDRSIPSDFTGPTEAIFDECFLINQDTFCGSRYERAECSDPYCTWDDFASPSCTPQEITPLDECVDASSLAECHSILGCLWGNEENGFIRELILPVSNCVTINPSLELDFGSVDRESQRTVTIRNDCDNRIEFDFSLRSGGLGFSLETASPLSIEPDSDQDVTINFDPSASDPATDILLIEFSSPEPQLRAVTLFGQSDL